MSFSERNGLKAPKTLLALNEISPDLRTGLWNVIAIHFGLTSDLITYNYNNVEFHLTKLIKELYINYFHRKIDQIPNSIDSKIQILDEYFDNANYAETFDFIEAVSDYYPFRAAFVDLSADFSDDLIIDEKSNFSKDINSILKREVAPYRFIDFQFIPITDEQEIAAIEKGLSTPIDPVRIHLQKALSLLSDKNEPDYENSIKESISAVESFVMKKTGKKKPLGELLNKYATELGLHPAMKDAFKSLYGYTSDKDGIRHASMDTSTADIDDAKYMLVT